MAITHKAGDSFDYTGVIKVNAAAQDMTGWTIRAQIRMTNAVRTLMPGLTAVFIDPLNAVANLSATAEATSTWPIGKALLDIQLKDPTGFTVSSDTVTVTIVEDVTRG